MSEEFAADTTQYLVHPAFCTSGERQMQKFKAVFRRGGNETDTTIDVSGSSPPQGPRRAEPDGPHANQPNPSIEPHEPDLSFPDGIKIWHDCADATVDICFVHGLTGNRDNTWSTAGSEPWPKRLLPSELPKARLLSYGYDAYIVRKSVASVNRLIDHATNLLNDLTNDRASNNAVSRRPLIFVAHSLGGLVCKEAILISRNNPEAHLRGIFDCVLGVLFMGTPHRGSWMAKWARIPAAALGCVKSTNQSLLDVLETDDQLLERIQIAFWSMVRERRESGRTLEVTCFFEELPLGVAGVVVPRESATLEGYSSFSIHANHKDMVRLGSAEETSFKRLLGELARWDRLNQTAASAQHAVEAKQELRGSLSPAVSRYIRKFLAEGSGSGWVLIDEFEHSIPSPGAPFAGGTFMAQYPEDPSTKLFLTVPSSKGDNRADWTVVAPNATYYPGKHSGHLIFPPDFPFKQPAVWWDTPLLSPYPRQGRFSGDIGDVWSPAPQSILRIVETMASIVLRSPRDGTQPHLYMHFGLHVLPKLFPGGSYVNDYFLYVDADWMRQSTQFFCRAYNRTDEDLADDAERVREDDPDRVQQIAQHHRDMSTQAIKSFLDHVIVPFFRPSPPFAVDGLEAEEYFAKVVTMKEWVDGEKRWAQMLDEKSLWMVSQDRGGGDRNRFYYM